MQLLRNASINRKLTLLVATAVAVALLLSASITIVNDIKAVRIATADQLSTLADVLGYNTVAAITFDDNKAAAQVLSSLRKQPLIEWACVYDAEGNVFATYARDGGDPPMPTNAPRPGYEFTSGGHLNVAHAIIGSDEQVGTIFLRASLESIYTTILGEVGVTGAILVVAFCASALLARRLQRRISDPILALAKTAQQISARKDYSIRVQRSTSDELGILYDEFNHMLAQIENSKQQLEAAHRELERRVDERTRQLSNINEELIKEIAERRRAETKLERMHRELVAAARRAGMAEIATGVLHNVGNVLNSVNVSATMIVENLRASKSQRLESVAALLEAHQHDLGDFLTRDEKGIKIPQYLRLLCDHLIETEQKTLAETNSLTAHIEHIKTIVATQQSYTRVGGMVEPTDVNTLLDDALRLYANSFERHEIRVDRQYGKLPLVLLDKQRLLQIIVNLVKNAKDALVEGPREGRAVTLRTRVNDDRLIIEISDTGIGIPAEHLTRIFSHGFTTKSSGHGFGLHSSANAAAEMDGSLTASSEGPMRGATFRLNLPLAAAMAPT